jgi:hypothetical protein
LALLGQFCLGPRAGQAALADVVAELADCLPSNSVEQFSLVLPRGLQFWPA